MFHVFRSSNAQNASDMLTLTVIAVAEAKAKVFLGFKVIDVAAQQVYFDEAEQKCQLCFDKYLVYL